MTDLEAEAKDYQVDKAIQTMRSYPDGSYVRCPFCGTKDSTHAEDCAIEVAARSLDSHHTELLAIHYAALNPMEVKPRESDTLTVRLVKEFIQRAVGTDPFTRSANVPVIPDGWQMVPSEPTDDMLDAAQEAAPEGQDDPLQAWATIYRAMLAYSPPAPVEEMKSAPAHTDHPLRHFDRTCPACVEESSSGLFPTRIEELAQEYIKSRALGFSVAGTAVGAFASWLSINHSASEATKLRELAERCRPAVAHDAKLRDREQYSDKYAHHYKPVLKAEAERAWKLLDDIDAIIGARPVKPHRSGGPTVPDGEPPLPVVTDSGVKHG